MNEGIRAFRVLVCITIFYILIGGSLVFAKSYIVEVDDKIAPYFERSLEVSPEEWLKMQAINAADIVIDEDYNKTRIQDRDGKIDIIEREK